MPLVTPPSASANSYTTVAEANAYFQTKPDGYAATWVAASATAKEAALIEATTILDPYPWLGVKAHALADNALAWPRYDVYNRDGQLLPANVVPPPVKRAVAELAQLILSGAVTAGGGASGAAGAAVTSISLGDVSLTFETGSKATATTFDTGYKSAVDQLIAPFVMMAAPAARLHR